MQPAQVLGVGRRSPSFLQPAPPMPLPMTTTSVSWERSPELLAGGTSGSSVLAGGAAAAAATTGRRPAGSVDAVPLLPTCLFVPP